VSENIKQQNLDLNEELIASLHPLAEEHYPVDTKLIVQNRRGKPQEVIIKKYEARGRVKLFYTSALTYSIVTAANYTVLEVVVTEAEKVDEPAAAVVEIANDPILNAALAPVIDDALLLTVAADPLPPVDPEPITLAETTAVVDAVSHDALEPTVVRFNDLEPVVELQSKAPDQAQASVETGFWNRVKSWWVSIVRYFTL
jgi:hypothetical protein